MRKVITRYPQCLLAACMLPWTAANELDVEVFRSHIRETMEAGYLDLYLMGTAGEGYALTDRQFAEVVGVFAEEAIRPGYRPQVGVISLSMSQAVERIGLARERGFRMFQISLPCWGALSDAEVDAFFKGVCGTYPDCQFLHYNLPRAKRILDGATYRRVADAHTNLVATKNSTSDYARVADLMRNVPDLQHFFLENGFVFGCIWGECSFLSSFAELFPKLTRQLFDAGRTGQWELACRLHKEINELEGILFGHVEGEHIDGTFDKTLCWLKNPRFSNRLLPPYIGLSEAESREVRERFKKHCGHLA
ncbi:MAG TPA: dihydrodipicolinate synthase family protein [Tepidisphaeraceae bacterium]|nr:dihydrodipicolinate synthase family protein [Tepidisphaeraceae bacterium]